MKIGGETAASAEALRNTSRLRGSFYRCSAVASAGARSTAIRVKNLTVRFGESIALDNITVGVPAASLTMIVGPPGGGKTALIRSLSGELPCGSGGICIQDLPARLWPAKKKESCLCTCPAALGVPCPFSDQASCSLLQNCRPDAVPNLASGVRKALRLLGVEHLQQRCESTLAERDRRRLELAFTVAPFLCGEAARCVHLWLDDPLDAIDGLHQHRLLQWLKETSRGRQTTVVTATDHALARLYADHSVLLAGGRVIAEGPPQTALCSNHLTRAFGNLGKRGDESL